MTEAWLTRQRVEAITALLEQLRGERWSIGTSQILNVHEVLIAIHERDEEVPSVAELARWIGPLVCSSRQQQREFPSRLAAVLEEKEKSAKPESPRPRREKRLGVISILLGVIGFAVLLYVLWWSRREAVVPVTATPPPAAPIANTAPAPSWSLPVSMIIGAAAGGATLVVVALWLWHRRRHEARLRRVVTNDLSVEDLFPSITGVPLALDFRRLAQTLRKRRLEESTELDAEATIEVAAARGGYVVPVYRQRARTPEYTFLIDQMSTDDVQAKVFERATTELAQHGVDVDVLFFHRDPRVCWREGRAKERFRFDSVASTHASRHLVLIGDGERLVDPRTGRPARWLDGFFGSFLDVAVMTPRSMLQWDQHEAFLTAAGALVLPATPAGILSYAGRGEPGARPPSPRSFSVAPALLDDDSMWISSLEPPREVIRELIEDLHLSLGDAGMRWLAATAVYPGVEWSVVLLLGRELRIPQFEENLLALARLPWFRRGAMPDWLRIRLIAALDPRTEQDVRGILFRMFEQAVIRESGDATLRIGRYRNLANALPQGSDLAERVIVDFMSGQKPEPLHLSLPERFVARIRRMMEKPRLVRRRKKRRRFRFRLHRNWLPSLLAYIPVAGLFVLQHKVGRIRQHAWVGTLYNCIIASAISGVAMLGELTWVKAAPYVLGWLALAGQGAYRAMRGRPIEGIIVPLTAELDRLARRRRPPRLPDTAAMRLMRMFYAPRIAFQRIAHTPNVFAPLAAMVLLTTISVAVTAPKLDYSATYPQADPATTERVARITEASGRVFAWLSIGLTPIAIAILALVLAFVLRIAGGRTTYKHALSVTLHAWLPRTAISALLSVAIIGTRESVDVRMIPRLVNLDLGRWTDMTADPVLYAVLSTFDLLSFWTIYLLVTGFAAVMRLTKRRIAITVISLWLVLVAWRIGMAALTAVTQPAAPMAAAPVELRSTER